MEKARAGSTARPVEARRDPSLSNDLARHLPDTVVITGFGGFIGSRTTALLLGHGRCVFGIDCFLGHPYPAERKVERVASLQAHDKFTFHHLDLRHDDLDHVIHAADVVIHFAAMAGLGTAGTEFSDFESHNVAATSRLLDSIASARTPAHLVHISTSSVYGAHAVGDEHQRLRPASPYGVTKLRAEALVGERVTDGSLSAITLRYFSVYGPNQRPDMAYARIIEALLADAEVVVTGDGSQRRTNTYVDDAAMAAVLSAIVQPKATLNIAGSESVTLLQAIAILEELLGKRARIRFIPARPGDQIETRGECRNASRLLGWQPTFRLREGLSEQAREAQLAGSAVLQR